MTYLQYPQMSFFKGHIAVVHLLLGHPDIDVNIANSLGYGPLLTAISSNATEIVEVLVGREDVDVNTVAFYGLTALIQVL